MEYAAFIRNLEKAFDKGLPGFNSQVKAAPKLREHPENPTSIKHAKKSAVLILLYPKNGNIYIPFIKRITDDSTHSGQIAFPGGKYELSDKELRNTAKRESEEEVGVNKNDISIIQELTPLYIPVSNYLVQPIVGKIDYRPDFVPNKEEVEEIYEVNISELYNSYIVEKNFSVREINITAPFFILDKIEIWGATAMILSEFIDIINTIDTN